MKLLLSPMCLSHRRPKDQLKSKILNQCHGNGFFVSVFWLSPQVCFPPCSVDEARVRLGREIRCALGRLTAPNTTSRFLRRDGRTRDAVAGDLGAAERAECQPGKFEYDGRLLLVTGIRRRCGSTALSSSHVFAQNGSQSGGRVPGVGRRVAFTRCAGRIAELPAVAAHLSSEHDPVEQVVRFRFSGTSGGSIAGARRRIDRARARGARNPHLSARRRRACIFLISGSVQSCIRFHGVDDLLVGTIRGREKSAPGIRAHFHHEPHREPSG